MAKDEKPLTRATILLQAAAAGITIRHIPARDAGKIIDGKTSSGRNRVIGRLEARPALWVVVRNGRRLDNFWSERRAVDLIRELLADLESNAAADAAPDRVGGRLC